jgi:hypothetical protein
MALSEEAVAALVRDAEALDDAGRTDEALVLLAPLVNFTAHGSDPSLPCLCRDCSALAGARVDAGGRGFARAFAVAGSRVLHFWLCDELAEQRAAVRRAVARDMAPRVKASRGPR